MKKSKRKYHYIKKYNYWYDILNKNQEGEESIEK